MSVSGHRLTVLPADRGARQRLKILQLLAAVEADGRTPLAEALRHRRQPAAAGDDGDRRSPPRTDPSFVRPLATLRIARASGRWWCCSTRRRSRRPPTRRPPRPQRQRSRAVRHALAEFEMPIYDHRPRAGPGGGAGTMIDPRTAPARGGLADARRSSRLMIAVVASAVDDPAWVNGRGDLTDGLVLARAARRRGRLHRAQGRLGSLDDARRRRAVRRPADPDRRGLGRVPGPVDRPGVRAHRRRHDPGVPRHRVAGARVHQPGGPLRRGPRDHHVGHRPVRLVRGVRAPPAAERRDRDRDRPRSRTCRSTFRERAAVHRRVHGRGAVPAHPDARVRRARDVDPAPDRRPEHDLVASTCAAGRCSSSRRCSARCC